MLFKKPSNHRDWSPDQATMPYAEFKNDTVHVHNIRNASYRTRDDFDLHYYDTTYDLNTIESVWFLLVPFGPIPGVAHTLLSFRFSDGQALALSVEVRRKRGEQFSLWRMFPHTYELMYVFADECDVIRLRTSIWKAHTYFFPLAMTRAHVASVFKNALVRANELRNHPEFYNFLSNNCTNNLMRHLQAGEPRMPSGSWRYVFASSILTLFYKMGLLNRNETPETIRKKYYVTDTAATCEDMSLFGSHIRNETTPR